MRTSRILGPVAATLLVAAAGLLAVPVAPASADPMAACSGRSGVIVVVDFKELGGGVTKGCDGSSGDSAAQSFAAAGYHLTYSQAPGMNGFVCTVQGKPTSGDCTGTDAYWSLWWSDGTSNTWTYSSLGADSLKVPAGGYVAFAWHQGAGKATGPGVQPTPRTAATPTPQPAHSASAPPTRHAQAHHAASPSVSVATSAPPSSSASPTTATPAATSTAKSRHHRAVASTVVPSSGGPSSLPSIEQVSAGPPADASTGRGAGTGTWLAIGLGVLVIGAAAAVPLLRRRRG